LREFNPKLEDQPQDLVVVLNRLHQINPGDRHQAF